MRGLDRLVTLCAVPLMLLNMFGGLVSGVTLLLLGRWRDVVAGIAGAALAPFILGLLVLLGFVFAGPAVYFEERNQNTAKSVFGFLSVLYTTGVLALWCAGVVIHFGLRGDSLVSSVALLIWAYTAAISPIAYMAKNERDNEFSAISTFFAEIAVVSAIVISLIFGIEPTAILVVVGAVMFIGSVVQVGIASALERQRRSLPF